MKKLYLLALLLFSFEKIEALPISNPAEASLFFCKGNYGDPTHQIGLKFGYYGDYVFNRHLKTVTGKNVDYTQIHTNAGYFALSFCERVDFFTTLGATQFAFNTSLSPFNPTNPSPRFDFETSTTFSWSGGARATVLEWKCLTIGAGGRYFAAHPEARRLFVRANVDDYPDEGSKKKYSEWQLECGVSYRYSCYFVPYVGVKYARASWKFNNQTFLVTDTLATIPNLKNGKNWGYAIGTSFAPFTCQKIAVTVEGRFGDEKALHINGHARF